MADHHGTYSVAPWVIYQSKDPLSAVHGAAGVDAAIVETPYERVRYEVYLHRIQGDTITNALIATLAKRASGELGIIIYAHSRNATDRSFLAKFGAASLHSSTGTLERPTQMVRFGPASDFYDVGSFREARWTGSITYRFVAAPCRGTLTMDVRDAYGRAYAFTFNPARFR